MPLMPEQAQGTPFALRLLVAFLLHFLSEFSLSADTPLAARHAEHVMTFDIKTQQPPDFVD